MTGADRLVEHLERSGDRPAEHSGPSAVLRLASRRRLSGEREVGQNGRIISTRGR